MNPKQLNNIPGILRNIDSWLLWKLEKNPVPGKKDLKVPYYASGKRRRGQLGSDEDKQKMASFKRCMQVMAENPGKYTGVGFAPRPEYNLTILDLDDCLDASGTPSEFASDVIASGTYVEISPSGNGLRAVYKGGAVIQGKTNARIDNGERVEIYCGNAFVTVTGNVFDEVGEVIDMPRKIRRTLKPLIEGNVSTSSTPSEAGLMSPDAVAIPELTEEHAAVILGKLPEEWGQPSSGTWYRVAAALHLQFDGSDAAYDVLDAWSQGLPGYDEAANRRRWRAGFSHHGGKDNLTTMRNLVFESIQKGGLKVKTETMRKWGLSRKTDEDFDNGDEAVSTLPTLPDLHAMASIHGMLTTEAPPIDWLVKGFIARKNVSILAGGSGTSKSYMTMQMCARAAVGMEDFGGMQFPAGGFKTLYFAYEDTKDVMHVRVGTLGEYLKEHLELFEGDDSYIDQFSENFGILTSDILDDGDFYVARKAGKYDAMEITRLCAYLREYVEQYKIDLLVFDTASETHTGDESNTGDMVVLMRAFRQLAASSGCAVLIIQHVNKGIFGLKIEELDQGSIRGSSVLVDKARNVMLMARMPQADAIKFGLPETSETHDSIVALKHVKANLGSYIPLTFFERESRGLLIHRADIIEQEFDRVVEGEDNARNDRTRIAAAANAELVFEYIRDKNEEGTQPSSAMVKAGMQVEHGLPDRVVRTALEYLESVNRIVRVDDPDHPRSNNWAISQN